MISRKSGTKFRICICCCAVFLRLSRATWVVFLQLRYQGPGRLAKQHLLERWTKHPLHGTMASSFQGSSNGVIKYLDLENPADLAKLDDASAYLRARNEGLLIIDEVQRLPGLFEVLRGVIDERVLQGQSAQPASSG